MFSFADTPLFVKVAVLVVLAATLAGFLGVVGLRFLRRGAARFWTVPASAALVLFPAVLGAGLAAILFRQTLSTVVLTGAGGRAALAGGSAEAILPLAFGLPATAMLALLALLVTGIGSGRAEIAESDSGKARHLGALAVVVLAAVLVVLVLGMVASVNAQPEGARAIAMRLQLALALSAVLLLVLCVLGIATALRAPRGPSPAGVKVLSLAIVSLSGVGALAGLGTIHGQMECLTHTGLTGLPCGVAPAAPATDPAPSPEEGADLSAEGTSAKPVDAGGPEPGLGAPVRIGGAIKEPRKLKHVSPAYPEIARRARVQGIVILECTIGRDGRIEHVAVLRGIPLLDAAAVEAVQQWVYAPTLVSGVPARVLMTVTVNFKLS